MSGMRSLYLELTCNRCLVARNRRANNASVGEGNERRGWWYREDIIETSHVIRNAGTHEVSSKRYLVIS